MSRLVLLLSLLILILATAVHAEPDANYNITSIKSEQLSNAVRVIIEADGAIAANVHKWWEGGKEEDYYLDWELVHKQTSGIWSADCYPKVDRIHLHLDNALPQVGSVFHVGKYPVSHVELAVTSDNTRVGMDLDICLHKPMRLRYFKLGDWDIWDAFLIDHHDPAWFEVVQSQDQRSLVVTVASDRIPQVSRRRSIDDVPESDRMLEVGTDSGLVSVHAKNSKLSDVVGAVSAATGTRMLVDPAAQRVVTTELSHVQVEEFASLLSKCYGLVLSHDAGSFVFSDISAMTTSAYTSGSTESIPVKWIKVEKARDLLPNFLLDYVRVDKERNALVVSGSPELAEKIAEDVAKIDKPSSKVVVNATLLELSHTDDLTQQLALEYKNNSLAVSVDNTVGSVTYSKIDSSSLPTFSVKLNALVASQKVKIKSESNVTVQSGETGEIFAGLDKYIVFQRNAGNVIPTAEPVSAGVKLSVTPWSGGHTVIMRVTVEDKNVLEVDPITNLPVVNSRTATGTFAILPGEKVIIGGLSQEHIFRTNQKIPILGNIPIIGKLFTRRMKQKTTSEFAILLEPKVEIK